MVGDHRESAAPVAPSQNAARHGKPSAPTLLGIGGNARTVTVVYDAPASDGGHTSHRYEATFNGGRTWTKRGSEVDDYGEREGSRRNLKINKHYVVAVRAVRSRATTSRRSTTTPSSTVPAR